MTPIEHTNPEAKSADLITQNIEVLKSLFPEAVSEGKVDITVLKDLLGQALLPEEERDEKYGLNWFGKRKARQIALTPSTGTLRPCKEESVDWDTTKNLMIEGDNLEVLKLLQKSYAGQVKLIYIDPPYNTGKDFVYPDNFRDNIKNYLELTGQIEGGAKIEANTESSGRFHTDWLNMMQPRLKLAKNLMRHDGVIFISIDENEFAKLKLLCDEIFGEENLVGNIVWNNVTDNNPSNIAVEHEYIICYCKEKKNLAPFWKSNLSDVKDLLIKIGDDLISKINNQEELQTAYSKWFREHKNQLWPLENYKYIDTNGVFSGERGVHNPGEEGYRYDIIHPITMKPCKQPLLGYRFPEDTMKRMIEDGKIIFGDDENKLVEIKVYAKDYLQKLSSVLKLDGRTGTNEVKELFPSVKKVFTNPKTIKLIKDLISFSCNKSDIILDFFAGSGSTGHAVFSLNAEDNGSRRCILIQLPELCSKESETFNAGYKTISEITKERLRRAGKKIREENPMFNGDTGFRVFKLDTSNILPWEPEWDKLDEILKKSTDHIKTGRSEADILYELLLKLGLDLAVPIDEKLIASKKVYSIGAGTLLVCLDKSIGRADADPLALGIVAWHKELAPVGETTCVFLDSGFADDVTKTNLSAILSQHGLGNLRSL